MNETQIRHSLSDHNVIARFRHFAAAALVAAVALTNGCQVQPGGGNAIPAEQQRVAFQSQCAQNVITCTQRFPTAVIDVRARPGQEVTATAAGFLVTDDYPHDPKQVQLIGSDSVAGTDATMLNFSWSFGATDDDPCTMTAGEEFSTQTDTLILLEPGFHYLRLLVENDVIFPIIESDTCGVIGENIPGFHFVEIEIEVR